MRGSTLTIHGITSNAGHHQYRRQHQQREPGEGDDALAVEPHAVAGSHDHRQPRQHHQRRDAAERAEPVAEQAMTIAASAGVSAKT